MKKYFPAILAAVVFLLALLMGQPEKQVRVVVAAADLPEGTTLAEADLLVKEMPQSLAPADAVSDPQALVGQRLRVTRSAGDPLLPTHLGGESLALAADERAVAVAVTDASGLAGLLKPGDRVGLIAVLNAQQELFSKYIAGNLRVLWISPEFSQSTPREQDEEGGVLGGSSTSASRAAKGIVVLAVPVNGTIVSYDFSAFGLPADARPVFLIDLLPALQSNGAQLTLVLEPENAREALTSGVALQSLVITPGPTPTPGADTGKSDRPDNSTGDRLVSPTLAPTPTP